MNLWMVRINETCSYSFHMYSVVGNAWRYNEKYKRDYHVNNIETEHKLISMLFHNEKQSTLITIPHNKNRFLLGSYLQCSANYITKNLPNYIDHHPLVSSIAWIHQQMLMPRQHVTWGSSHHWAGIFFCAQVVQVLVMTVTPLLLCGVFLSNGVPSGIV